MRSEPGICRQQMLRKTFNESVLRYSSPMQWLWLMECWRPMDLPFRFSNTRHFGILSCPFLSRPLPSRPFILCKTMCVTTDSLLHTAFNVAAAVSWINPGDVVRCAVMFDMFDTDPYQSHSVEGVRVCRGCFVFVINSYFSLLHSC